VSIIQQTRSVESGTPGLLGRARRVAREHGATAFWGLMAAAHMPALAGCWYKIATGGITWSGVGSCLLLSASMTFFLLKVVDYRPLRFRLTRQSGVALCVLVAFMHFDAIRSSDNPTLILEYTSIIATTFIASRPVTMRRDLVVSGAHGHQTDTLLSCELRSTDTVWTDIVHPHCWTRCMRIYALRAPPA